MNATDNICLLLGNLMNWLLQGVLIVQLYLYCLAFPKDKVWIKSIVYVVFGLETIQTIGLSVTLLFIINMAQETVINNITWVYVLNLELMLLSGSVVPMIVQCVYAHRIKVITDMKVLPWFIVALAILQFIAAVLVAFVPLAPIYIWLGINVLNDIIIAIIMVRTLLKQQLFSSSDTTAKTSRLLRLIIGAGLTTVAVNLVALAFVASPIPVYMTLIIILPKLYANSNLVMLNNRMSIGGRLDNAKAVEPSLATHENMSSASGVRTASA